MASIKESLMRLVEANARTTNHVAVDGRDEKENLEYRTQACSRPHQGCPDQLNKRISGPPSDIQDSFDSSLVMSRTNWFKFLKVVFD